MNPLRSLGASGLRAHPAGPAAQGGPGMASPYGGDRFSPSCLPGEREAQPLDLSRLSFIDGRALEAPVALKPMVKATMAAFASLGLIGTVLAGNPAAAQEFAMELSPQSSVSQVLPQAQALPSRESAQASPTGAPGAGQATSAGAATSQETSPTEKTAPTFEDVKKRGAVIEKDEQGPPVAELQGRLTALGFKTGSSGTMDGGTQNALKLFQKSRGVKPTGRFGPTSLAALERAEKEPPYSAALGARLVKHARAIATSRNTIGACYEAVGDALDKLGIKTSGLSAYMAAPQLASHHSMKEIKVKAAELPELPAGAVVVWGKTKASPHGHIAIADGRGNELSDHVEAQRTDLRGYTNFRVFVPVEK